MTDLEGKVALVVGASRGIGRAIARDPATRGADLAPTATSREGVERTASECRSESVGVLSLALDMSAPEFIRIRSERGAEPFRSIRRTRGKCRNQSLLRKAGILDY